MFKKCLKSWALGYWGFASAGPMHWAQNSPVSLPNWEGLAAPAPKTTPPAESF